MIPHRLFRSFHIAMVIEHLKRLKETDRRLRFGAMLPDDAIEDYVSRSWSDNDVWFGVVQDGEVIAAVHVAQEDTHTRAELGLSVDPEWRGNKLGQSLFERAVIALKARNIRDVYMHCLAENAVIKHIARKNKMVMVTEYGETDADLILTESTPADISTNIAFEQLALYDSLIRNTSGAWKKIYENN
jgi:GNAT superfamily N-acetyltransferase